AIKFGCVPDFVFTFARTRSSCGPESLFAALALHHTFALAACFHRIGVRIALVHRRAEILILARGLLTRQLLGGWRNFLCVRRSGFLCRGLLRVHSIRTVKAGAVSGQLIIHGVIDVGVMDNVRIYARHSGVVLEVVSTPSAAPVAISGVAITVINASIKTDSRSPVTSVKHVSAVVPAPPWRSPKYAHCRRCNPGARNPIIIPGIITIIPVTRSPDITCDRAGRLLIYRQNRRSEIDRYTYLCERGRQRQCEQSS